MDPYPFKGAAICRVCGEPGDANARSAWSAEAVHVDPNVCRYNLERRRRKLEKREEALSANE